MIRSIVGYGAVSLAGLVVGLVGAVGHRSAPPWWGAVLVVVMTLSAAIFVRAARGWLALGIFAAFWYGTVTAVYVIGGPSDSVLIIDDALGKALFFGGGAAVVAAALVPARWLRDVPLRGAASAGRRTVDAGAQLQPESPL